MTFQPHSKCSTVMHTTFLNFWKQKKTLMDPSLSVTEMSGLLAGTYLIISVHLTASCSSINLSLYWFLSISTRAISTRVNLFRWAAETFACKENNNWHLIYLIIWLVFVANTMHNIIGSQLVNKVVNLLWVVKNLFSLFYTDSVFYWPHS